MKKDKKKKILYTVYTVVFMGICIAPAALMPLKKSNSSLENRVLAEKPKIMTESGSLNLDFFSQFDDYFSEHFAFRQELVTLDSKLHAEIMGTSSDDDVIVGKDGWLYYAPTSDDFMNINTLSDRAISNINHNLQLLGQYCADNNSWFTVVVAPNKNSIYPEYMPYNYIQTDSEDNYSKLLAAAEEQKELWSKSLTSSNSETEIPRFYNFIDMKSVLLEKKANSSVPIYHKTDTHWNNIGALAARDSLLSLSDATNGFFDSYWKSANDWSGDLAEMLYPSDTASDTQYYSSYEFSYDYVGRFKGLDELEIQTTCEGKSGSLLMYRDSFGEAILPFMADSFGSAAFSRSVPYRTESIADGTAETVILEIVERNIGNLQKYAPVMPAPIYEGEKIIPVGSSSDYTLKCESNGSYSHIYGELSNDFFSSDDAVIYVTVDDITYEAFNAFEDKLLDREGEVSDNGFSLYIPVNNEIDLNNISVTVMCENRKAVTTK